MSLGTVADGFSIAAGAVVISGAMYAYWQYAITKRLRRRQLERYFKEELSAEADRGRRSVVHLMGHLRMTEGQIVEAGYSSPRIEPIIRTDPETGLAQQLLFQYSPDQ